MREITRKVLVIGQEKAGKSSLIDAILKAGPEIEGAAVRPGIRVLKKLIPQTGKDLRIIFWDINGESLFGPIPPSFLVGSNLMVFVLDASRPPEPVEFATRLTEIQLRFPKIPIAIFLNKSDLVSSAKIRRILKSFPVDIDLVSNSKEVDRVDEALAIILDKAYAEVIRKTA